MHRYLIVLNGYSGAISGGDDHALRLLTFLCHSGFDVSIVLPKDAYLSQVPKSARRLDVPVLPYERYLRRSNITLLFVYLWRILFAWRLIFRFSPSRTDSVLMASHLFHDTLPMLMQSRNHHETVYIYHLIRNGGSRKSFSTSAIITLERISFWLIRSRAMFAMTSSSTVKDQLISILHVSHSRIGMTENGVDLDMINAVPEQSRSNDIVFCGRFVPHKGVLDLLDVISKIKRHQFLSAVLIGKGPLLEKVRQRIDAELFDTVTVDINANDWNKFRLIKSSKVFVLPSYEEGWGIVIGEALACGVPVVAYDIPEIRSIWGDDVVWVPKGDKDALTKVLLELLNSSKKTAQRAAYWQERLDWERICAKEIALIERGGV